MYIFVSGWCFEGLMQYLEEHLPKQQKVIMETFDYFEMASETSAFGKCIGKEVNEHGETLRMHK